MIFTDTTVVTGDPDRTVLYNVALAVVDDTIAAIGPTDSLRRAYRTAEIYDGRGKALFPGLINNHCHLSASLDRGHRMDIGFPAMVDIPRSSSSFLEEGEREVFVILAVLEAIQSGTTTLVEYTSNIAANAEALAATGLRLVFAEGVNDSAAGIGAVAEDQIHIPPDFQPELRESGLQRINDLFDAWHGAEQGRISVFPAVTHTENASPELLQAVREFAENHDLGYTIHHAQSRPEIDYMLEHHGVRPTEYLLQHDFLGPRLFAAHCRYVNETDIEMLGDTDTIIASIPTMAANRAVNPPITALRDAGCTIALGSDNGITDMLDVMRTGVKIERIGTGNQTFPQPEDLLEDATRGNSQALRQEALIGSLEVGKKADLLVMDTQRAGLVPTTRIVASLNHFGEPNDIESLMVDGEFVMRDHRVLTIDEDRLVAEADRIGRRIWNQVIEAGADEDELPGSIAPRL